MNNSIEHVEVIINSLSALIYIALRRAAHEQNNSSASADFSDEVIADAKASASELRRLRTEFENITSGIIL